MKCLRCGCRSLGNCTLENQAAKLCHDCGWRFIPGDVTFERIEARNEHPAAPEAPVEVPQEPEAPAQTEGVQ